jgi:hypothetical protein
VLYSGCAGVASPLETVLIQDDRAEKLREIRDLLASMRTDIQRQFENGHEAATETIDRLLESLPEDMTS